MSSENNKPIKNEDPVNPVYADGTKGTEINREMITADEMKVNDTNEEDTRKNDTHEKDTINEGDVKNDIYIPHEREDKQAEEQGVKQERGQEKDQAEEQDQDEKKVASLAQVWPVIYRWMKPYGLAVAILLIFIAADAVFDWGLAFVQGFFVDAIQDGGQQRLNNTAIIFIAILAGFIVLLAMHRYVLVWLKESMHRDMSMDLLKLLNRMPYAWVRRQKSGDVMLRIKEDTKHGAEVVEAIAEGVTVVFIIALSLGYLYRADAWVAVIALISAAAIWFTARLYDGRIIRLSDEVESREGESQQQIQQYVEGIPVIQAYHAAPWFLTRFRTQQQSLNKVQAKLQMTLSMSDNVAMAVFGLAQLAALFLIALSAARGTLSPGMVVASSLLFELVVWPVLGLSSQWSQMQSSVGAFGRISAWLERAGKMAKMDRFEGMQETNVHGREISHNRKSNEELDRATEELPNQALDRTLEKTSNKTLEQPAHQTKNQENERAMLRLRQVMVSDEESGRIILDQITLNLVPGELVAVVGASGAGKSTLCQVCAGLIEPTNGNVMLHDKEVTQYLAMDSQSTLTYMPQTPTFFTGTMEENIRLGRDVTLDKVKLAAVQAGLHEFIEAQEGQYEAPLQEKGANLSGGQQQRLSLARLFLRTSDVYILDEPTSSLDVQTEHHVMKHLLTFMKGKIGLLVTHRMEVAQQCPRILVMDQGRIVEDGTHEQLMGSKGLYYHMNGKNS
ncbi:ABC transporter ATP-binding protein [Paenibacillus sp. MER 99-2]|uniref:ABC transporter ATP-binding protein n=1 Tax=Paenibacillus sp. MER 99-2 TaxID=2939572 RepID=UPI00203E5833|nr:ABC transporter ATP-binding protein [Paenibacillus sp. MER 99-2]MCM3172881.1 ABC transporter ATP-binding protein/permease [Paenibacillus sp. MER 99-2]